MMRTGRVERDENDVGSLFVISSIPRGLLRMVFGRDRPLDESRFADLERQPVEVVLDVDPEDGCFAGQRSD
jgi:hypothetical protein